MTNLYMHRVISVFARVFLITGFVSFINGCAVFPIGSSQSVLSRDGPPKRDVDENQIADAVPRHEVIRRAGNKSPYTVLGRTYHVDFGVKAFTQSGLASWYGTKFHGNKTANGEVYDMYAMTAAHKTLPIPSYVKVTNLENQRTVVVRVNDRGPFHPGRVIDLSYVAAKKLDLMQKGTAKVRLELLTSAASASDSAQTYLQVGAFGQNDRAKKLRDQLALKLKKPVFIAKDGELYKVIAGPFEEESLIAEAESTLVRLAVPTYFRIQPPSSFVSAFE